MTAARPDPRTIRWSIETRLRRDRRERWLREGDMSVGRRLAQIGVLGWIFVVPDAGRAVPRALARCALRHRASSGPRRCMVLGLCLGGWTAWKWMNAR